LGKNISSPIINDIINDIINEMISKFEAGHTVEVENFGTFSPFHTPVHRSVDIITGQPFITVPRKSVKFHAHCNLLEMIRQRKEIFLGKKKSR